MYNVANVQIGSRETKSGSFPNNFFNDLFKIINWLLGGKYNGMELHEASPRGADKKNSSAQIVRERIPP